MTNLTKLVILSLLTLFLSKAFAQSNTYALIVGVAKYQRPSIKHLKYADDDAIMISKLITSTAFGAKPQNIRLLINDSATSVNVLNGLMWLYNSAIQGDKVIFYFSGHMDALDSELTYLLSYDASGEDPQLYDFTSINMYKVIQIFKKISLKGVLPVMIFDIGKVPSLASKNLMYNQTFGGIQMISAQPGQSSFEDSRWGGGHAVFSYYLAMGAVGLADENDNKSISVGELCSYITKMVKGQTFDNINKKALQVPFCCCSDNDDKEFSKVDQNLLDKVKKTNNLQIFSDDEK